MAFFRPVYGSNSNDPSFTPLFRMLEDFDNYSRTQTGNGHRHRAHLPSFQPKFDVRETETAYELHGELAGMNKQDVQVEFTDPQTMMIRGRIERSYSNGTSPAIEEQKTGGAITEGTEEHSNGHKATVQDETEAEKEETQGHVVQAKNPADKAKYWVSERSIGEFSRSFNFPHRVDQDSVTANLENGILSVTVPKAKKHEARRINIQ